MVKKKLVKIEIKREKHMVDINEMHYIKERGKMSRPWYLSKAATVLMASSM